MKTLEITVDDETAALRCLLSNIGSLETVAAAAEALVGEADLRAMLRCADEDFAAGRSITLEALEERYAD